MGKDDSFYETLDSETQARFQSLGQARHYPSGTTLFNEGEISDKVIVVSGGIVKISYFTIEGKEVLLGIRGSGDLIGDMSALDGKPRSATATAIEPVDALIITTAAFTDLVLSSHDVTMSLVRLLSARLREADRKRIEFGAMDATGRVATRLIELVERFGTPVQDGVRISVPLSQQDLAGWTGSSREAVSKALQTLRSRNVVETHRRGITVLDPEGLARRAR